MKTMKTTSATEDAGTSTPTVSATMASATTAALLTSTWKASQPYSQRSSSGAVSATTKNCAGADECV